MATTSYRIQDLKQYTGSLSTSDFLLVKIKKRTGMIGDEDMKISMNLFLDQLAQGFFPITGGVLKGNLTIANGYLLSLADKNDVAVSIGSFTSDNRLQLGNINRGLTLVTISDVQIKRGANSYEVYHAGNLPNVTKIDSYYNAGFVGTSHSINMGQYTDYQMTLQNPTTALDFSSGFVKRAVETITMLITQGSGSNKVTWPDNIKWANGYPPTLSYKAGKTDIITFISYDLGESWLGLMTAAGVS